MGGKTSISWTDLQKLCNGYNNYQIFVGLMKHNEGHFDGFDGTKLYYQSWTPEDQPVGVVIVQHGFVEHSGRYQNVVNTLIPSGYSVWSYDLRGHGQSEGKWAYVNRFTDYFKDLEIFENLVREKHPNLPLHLVGHSMGSIIVAHYLTSKTDQTSIKSITLSASGLQPGAEYSKARIFLAKLFSSILPKIYIGTGVDPNFISHDKAVVEAYDKDPLITQKTTPRLGAELLKYVLKMEEVGPKIQIPTMMQNGSLDTAFHPEGVKPLYDTISSPVKEFKLYDGFKHEIYNEVKKEQPLNDMKDWINKHNI
ncbi:MAG: alpha/beta hydrolase [Candidatus Kariarchaeaceae archaeon]|jgi:alpha-beta hydrolase superfamily lysophospholipase